MRKPQRGYVIAPPTEPPENGKIYLFLGYLMTPSELHMLYTVSILDRVVSLMWSQVKEVLEGCDCGIIKVLSLGRLRKIMGNLRQKSWYPDQDLNWASPGCDFSALAQHHSLSNSHVDITDDDKLKNIKVQWSVVACCSSKVSLTLWNMILSKYYLRISSCLTENLCVHVTKKLVLMLCRSIITV